MYVYKCKGTEYIYIHVESNTELKTSKPIPEGSMATQVNDPFHTNSYLATVPQKPPKFRCQCIHICAKSIQQKK